MWSGEPTCVGEAVRCQTSPTLLERQFLLAILRLSLYTEMGIFQERLQNTFPTNGAATENLFLHPDNSSALPALSFVAAGSLRQFCPALLKSKTFTVPWGK